MFAGCLQLVCEFVIVRVSMRTAVWFGVDMGSGLIMFVLLRFDC